MILSGTDLVVAGLAAIAAGMVNAFAGGGTLISFPALVALGIPEIAANVTSTVAMSPGYLGGALAQKNDLSGQKQRLRLLVPTGIIGGVIGAVLLLVASPQVFRVLIPFLILGSSLLLALQDRVRKWIVKKSGDRKSGCAGIEKSVIPVGLAAVYGGYFGAGLSVLTLAILGLFIEDDLRRLNALKQGISFAANIAAAVLFLFSGMIIWPAAIVMAVGAFAGGAVGGRVAGRIDVRHSQMDRCCDRPHNRNYLPRTAVGEKKPAGSPLWDFGAGKRSPLIYKSIVLIYIQDLLFPI